MARKTPRVLTDEQWERIAPHLPAQGARLGPAPGRRGGGRVRPGHPAPEEPGEAGPDRRPAAAAVQAAVAGGADERLAALLPGSGRPLVPLLVPVRRPRVPGLYPHGTTEVLNPPLLHWGLMMTAFAFYD